MIKPINEHFNITSDYNRLVLSRIIYIKMKKRVRYLSKKRKITLIRRKRKNNQQNELKQNNGINNLDLMNNNFLSGKTPLGGGKDPIAKIPTSTEDILESTATVYVVYSPRVTSESRIRRDLAVANNIWDQCNIQFELVGLDARTNLPNEEDSALSRIVPQALGVSIIVFYLPTLEDGALGRASFESVFPFPIFIANGAPEDTLAHEFGHALLYTNRFGVISDPNPYNRSNDQSGRNYQPEHNNDPNNLMWPYDNGGTELTSVQCRRMRGSILLRP